MGEHVDSPIGRRPGRNEERKHQIRDYERDQVSGLWNLVRGKILGVTDDECRRVNAEALADYSPGLRFGNPGDREACANTYNAESVR